MAYNDSDHRAGFRRYAQFNEYTQTNLNMYDGDYVADISRKPAQLFFWGVGTRL